MKLCRVIGMLAAAGVFGVVSLLGATSAYAGTSVATEASTQIIQGQYVRLVSVADWDAAGGMLPGERVQWDIEISANAPDPGTLTVGISATGGAPLVLDAMLCLQAWTASGCPGGARVLDSNWAVPLDGSEVTLTKISSTEVGHLRLMVGLSPTGEQGATELRVHAHGVGEEVIIGPGGGGLATTGMSPLVPWIFGGGAGLIIFGLVFVLSRKRRTASHNEEDAP